MLDIVAQVIDVAHGLPFLYFKLFKTSSISPVSVDAIRTTCSPQCFVTTSLIGRYQADSLSLMLNCSIFVNHVLIFFKISLDFESCKGGDSWKVWEKQIPDESHTTCLPGMNLTSLKQNKTWQNTYLNNCSVNGSLRVLIEMFFLHIHVYPRESTCTA